MRAISFSAIALLLLVQACSESSPARPSNAYFGQQGADIVQAVYEADKNRFLAHYAEEGRDQVWGEAGGYVGRYQPFGPAAVEGTEVEVTADGVNVEVSYRTAAGAPCRTFVYFRPGRGSYRPALHPLSATAEGCIGAWGGSGE